MLFVTHDLDLIGRVVDTVAVMYGGRVVETGPAELIRRSPRHHYTKALHDAVPADHPRHRKLAATAVPLRAGSVAHVAGDARAAPARAPETREGGQIKDRPSPVAS